MNRFSENRFRESFLIANHDDFHALLTIEPVIAVKNPWDSENLGSGIHELGYPVL